VESSPAVSAQTALFIGGALSEFFGIVLIAFPTYCPAQAGHRAG
jgi:hypothetical protein